MDRIAHVELAGDGAKRIDRAIMVLDAARAHPE